MCTQRLILHTATSFTQCVFKVHLHSSRCWTFTAFDFRIVFHCMEMTFLPSGYWNHVGINACACISLWRFVHTSLHAKLILHSGDGPYIVMVYNPFCMCFGVSFAVIKHHGQSIVGRKGLSGLYPGPWYMEVSWSRSSRQEVKQRTEERCFLAGFPWLAQSAFIIT